MTSIQFLLNRNYVVILKLVLRKTNLKLLPLTYKQGIESIFNVRLKKYMIDGYSCNKNDFNGLIWFK
jgi:hypothetical protein